MQAIILAAGMGRRLKELTEDSAKCMVQVNGVTLIERSLLALDKLQLTRIILVTGCSRIADYYKTVNIYKFGRDFSAGIYVSFLEAYCEAMGHNEYYEQVLKVIAYLDKPVIRAARLTSEKWYEIDDEQDLDIAGTIFCGDEERLGRIQARYGGYWRYPDLLDFCYT